MVQNEDQDIFCSKVPRCEKKIMKDAAHEILMENDTIRTEAIKSILQFLQS